MAIRRTANIRIKSKKMEKRSYIFIAAFGKELHSFHQLLYSRLSLGPNSIHEYNRATGRSAYVIGLRMSDNRHVKSKQQNANPRLMQYYWQLLADIKDEMYPFQ